MQAPTSACPRGSGGYGGIASGGGDGGSPPNRARQLSASRPPATPAHASVAPCHPTPPVRANTSDGAALAAAPSQCDSVAPRAGRRPHAARGNRTPGQPAGPAAVPGVSEAAAHGSGSATTMEAPAWLRPSHSVPCAAVAHFAPPPGAPPAQPLPPTGPQQPSEPNSGNLERTCPCSPPQPRPRLHAGVVGPAGLPPSPLTSPGEPPTSQQRKPQLQPQHVPEQHIDRQLRPLEAYGTGDATCGGWLHPYEHDPGGSAKPHLTHGPVPAVTPQREAPLTETPVRPPTTHPAVIPNPAPSSSACNASLSVFASASGMAAAATVLAGMASTPPTAPVHTPGAAGGCSAIGQQAAWQQLGCCIQEEATMGWLEDAQPARSGSKGGSSGGWGAGPGAGAGACAAGGGSLHMQQHAKQQAAKLGNRRRDERQKRTGLVQRDAGIELRQHLLNHGHRWDDRDGSSSVSGSSASSSDPHGCVQVPKSSSVPPQQTACTHTTAGTGSACGPGLQAEASAVGGWGPGRQRRNSAGPRTADGAESLAIAAECGNSFAVTGARADTTARGHADGVRTRLPWASLPRTAAGRWLSHGAHALRSVLSRGSTSGHGALCNSGRAGGTDSPLAMGGAVGVGEKGGCNNGEVQDVADVSRRRLSGRALLRGVATSEAGCSDGGVREAGPSGLAPCRPRRGVGGEDQGQDGPEEEHACVTPSSMGERLVGCPELCLHS